MNSLILLTPRTGVFFAFRPLYRLLLYLFARYVKPLAIITAGLGSPCQELKKFQRKNLAFCASLALNYAAIILV